MVKIQKSRILCHDVLAPDEGHSDDGEDFSVHDDSEAEGADNTENESVADSSAAFASALSPQEANQTDQSHLTEDIGIFNHEW